MATWLDHQMFPLLGVLWPFLHVPFIFASHSAGSVCNPCWFGHKNGKMQKPTSPATYKGSLESLPVFTEALGVFIRMNRVVISNNA